MTPPPFRPWPTDAAGRLLPAAPVRGLTIDVQTGAHIAQFHRWRVIQCSRVRFTARRAGRTETVPTRDWVAWLDARAGEGTLTAHRPGCCIDRCRGCDTAPIGRPAASPPAPASGPRSGAAPGLGAALRGLGGPSTHPWAVTIDPSWAQLPACTCPAFRADPRPCAHIVAEVGADPTLRCQLLGLFL